MTTNEIVTMVADRIARSELSIEILGVLRHPTEQRYALLWRGFAGERVTFILENDIADWSLPASALSSWEIEQ